MIRAITIIILLMPSMVLAGNMSVKDNLFFGISPPVESVRKAKELALQDVICQVLRSIGAEYSLRFSSVMTGSDDHAEYRMSEKFSYSASGFISDIDRNIVSESHEKTSSGIVYRIGVRFTLQEIDTFRRLSLGAKVHAVWVGNDMVELREVNGVPVVLTEYTVKVDEKNDHARFLSHYVMKVAAGNSQKYCHALSSPLHLQDGLAHRVRLSVPEQKNTGLRDVLLGTRRSVKVIITGEDSIGRSVSAVVK